MNESENVNSRKVYKVAELTRLIKTVLENEFENVWVEGELSNVRRPSSGHLYFTVKDESSQITAVLFRGNQRGLNFEVKDGLQVRVFGEISVYEKSGNYQIIVRQMEESGQGALQAKFEALKKKLQEEGLFDKSRKQPIPLLPRHVGVITSPTGAAIRDILNVVSRRFPNLHILLAPVKVQGEGAAEEIASAIDLLNQRGGLDVLIVGRGGGSLEDLWCFNEEIVARAIARSEIPVISAVGHEIDFTISDFVADLRAPTPSAAAELVVGCKEEFEERLVHIFRRLSQNMQADVLRASARLQAAAGSYVFREPGRIAAQYHQHMEGFALRMSHELEGVLVEGRQRLDEGSIRMGHSIRESQNTVRHQLQRLSSQFKALNPLAVLARGYSVTCDEKGHVLKSISEMRQGQRVRTRLADGAFESEVKSLER